MSFRKIFTRQENEAWTIPFPDHAAGRPALGNDRIERRKAARKRTPTRLAESGPRRLPL